MFFAGLFVILLGASAINKKMLQKNEAYIPFRNKAILEITKEKEQTIDVLVLGDSLSYSSISPMQLWKEKGITSFIGGQPGQNIQETYNMLTTALKKQKPKTVILETNVMFRGNGGYSDFKDMLHEWVNTKFSLYKNHDIWKSLIIKKETEKKRYKGFDFRCAVKPYTGQSDYMIKTDETEEMPDRVKIFMEKIVTTCRDNQIELILLSTPSPENYNYKKHNALTAYASENGLRYVDMNLMVDQLGIDWNTDSLDRGDHLNFSGAVKVTTYLGNYLKEQVVLEDHRNDLEYKGWSQLAGNYELSAKENMIVK